MIFACLGMIVVFNLTSQKLIENAEGDIVSVLPAQSILLTIEYPNITVERLGRHWRVTPSDTIEQGIAESVIKTWLGLHGEITLSSSDEQGYRVMVWLAGNEQASRYWVQPESGLITNVISQKVWRISQDNIKRIGQLHISSATTKKSS